jgi:hypothetical protein
VVNRDVRIGKYAHDLCQSHFSCLHLQSSTLSIYVALMTQIMAIIWEVLPGIHAAVWHKLEKRNRRGVSNCVYLGKFLTYYQGQLNLLGETGCHLRQQNLWGGESGVRSQEESSLTSISRPWQGSPRVKSRRWGWEGGMGWPQLWGSLRTAKTLWAGPNFDVTHPPKTDVSYNVYSKMFLFLLCNDLPHEV